MKKIAIALTALAGIVYLSGCAYDNDYGRSAYGYGYAPPVVHHYYFNSGTRRDCLYDYDAAFCG